MKTLSKIILFIAFLFSADATLLAQNSDSLTINTDKKYKHQIGFSAGFSTGVGIAYRYTPNNWGIQLTYAPIYQEDEVNTQSFAITNFLNIYEGKKNQLYGFWGNHFIFSQQYTDYDYSSEKEVETNNLWISGIGVGAEFNFQKVLSINVMTGFASYYQITEEKESVNMTIEFSLLHRF